MSLSRKSPKCLIGGFVAVSLLLIGLLAICPQDAFAASKAADTPARDSSAMDPQKPSEITLKLKTKKLTIKRGQSKQISYSPKRKNVYMAKNATVELNKKKSYGGSKAKTLQKYIKVSSKGKVTVDKRLKKGSYKLGIVLFSKVNGNIDATSGLKWITVSVK